LPSDGDKKDSLTHCLYIGQKIWKRIAFFTRKQKLIKNHPQVRNGKGWDGVRSMIGIGEHLDIQMQATWHKWPFRTNVALGLGGFVRRNHTNGSVHHYLKLNSSQMMI
jgi:hypothetical protein